MKEVIENIIKQTIEFYINPSIKEHDGFCSLINFTVYKKVIVINLNYSGGCHSCSSIVNTNKMIENLIKDEIEEKGITGYRINVKYTQQDIIEEHMGVLKD